MGSITLIAKQAGFPNLLLSFKTIWYLQMIEIAILVFVKPNATGETCFIYGTIDNVDKKYKMQAKI